MSLLDNRSLIKQLDHDNYLSHILDVPEQIRDGFELGGQVTFPALYAQAKHVLIISSVEMLPVAMALEALAFQYARVPVTVLHDYLLPNWVSNDTLVVALDYYGTTDQVLTVYREAAKRRSRLLAISLEGDLARESRRYRAPHIPLSYGAPARVAFYYVFGCVAHIFKKLDLNEVKEPIATEAATLCRALLDSINHDVPAFQNAAKQLAENIASRKTTVIVGSGPLVGVAKKWHITLAATGKIVASYSTLGEFNDTIINGLRRQAKEADAGLVILLQSKYDHQRNKLQQTLTYQVAQARGIALEQVFMHPSGSLFGEIALASLLGDMVSYYVALLTSSDPSNIEATVFIKQHLLTEESA